MQMFHVLAASSMVQGGVDLKAVIILVFVLAVIAGLCYWASLIPANVWFIKWGIWFVLGAVAIVMIWRFLQNL